MMALVVMNTLFDSQAKSSGMTFVNLFTTTASRYPVECTGRVYVELSKTKVLRSSAA